ncbi:metal ABC transporter substrate-binding protein [Pelotomaculum sp. PtaB.Bin117]|uniref:metal ABC transporter substrate-binding protein n=1 Tax=Pelotomaculum sp. PtaB.Bin117 TaxID=1811694 RepID=UPI00257EDF38|nr:metal ABC transporter substrate-binding protein [Pelotomaculum sp. PtaB.Bin117]
MFVEYTLYKDRTFASGGRDPHIWLSPKRVKVMIEAIACEMCKLDEANKDIYTKNAEAYINQLDELDKQISSVLDNVKSKKFIVYHPAFGYFAEEIEGKAVRLLPLAADCIGNLKKMAETMTEAMQ